MTYWGAHPSWTSLGGLERAAAMALMEADGKDFDSAKNALGAMLNRAHRDKVDLGEHVSARIYQPTIEPAQFARLPSILSSAEHKRLAELARRRMSGQEPDWVRGATHFLAPEKTMLGLSAREPQKYRSWPQWTGFNPQSGQYSNVVLRDRSHAFLAPEGRYSADYGYQQPPDGMDTATYGAPEPSASPRMALGGPKPGSGPMATYTPVNGQSPSPFTGMTPEEVELYRRQGLRNTQLANDASPVGHWTQALARVVQGGLGGYQLSQAARGERAGQQAASQALISALSGGDPKLAIAGMAGHPWARPLAEKLASGVLQGELEARSPMGKLKHRALELDVQGKEELAPVEREARKEEIEAKRSQRQMDQWILGQMQGEAPAAATPASPAHAGALPLSPVPGISVAPPTGAAPAPVPASTPTPANRVQSLREVLASRSPADRMAFLMAYRKDPGKAAEMLAGWADPDKKLKEAADKERGEQIGKAQAALPKVIKDTDAVLKQIDDLLYVADPKNPGKYLPDPKDPSKLRSNPELSKGLGWFAGNAPDWMKGSDIHDVQEKLKQVGGGAFLQAYESLRGAGSITEKEAEPATTALARLRNLRQSDPGYRAALRDFRDRVVDLRKLAHDRASGKVPMPTETPVRTPQPGGAAPASGGDPLTEARAAIAKGAPRDKVIERLRERGIDPAGL